MTDPAIEALKRVLKAQEPRTPLALHPATVRRIVALASSERVSDRGWTEARP